MRLGMEIEMEWLWKIPFPGADNIFSMATNQQLLTMKNEYGWNSMQAHGTDCKLMEYGLLNFESSN